MRLSTLTLAVAFLLAPLAALAQTDTDATPEQPTREQRLQRRFGPDARVVEHRNSDQDLLRVIAGRARPVDGRYVSYVLVRWGDLDQRIAGGGREYYSNWDGSLTVRGGTAEVIRTPAFDDRPGARGEPRQGSGRDKLLNREGSTIRWQAGVVGWTDGLVIKITYDDTSSSATLQAGKFTVDLDP